MCVVCGVTDVAVVKDGKDKSTALSDVVDVLTRVHRMPEIKFRNSGEPVPMPLPDVSTELDSDVVPRDPTWDLKRDLEPKLKVLEKRTNRAIVELLRRRLEES